MVTDPTNGRLRSALEELRATHPDVRREFPDAIYANKEDLLLQHGRFFEPQTLPPRYRRFAAACFRRRAATCFDNALKLALKAGLRYAEGLVVITEGFLLIPHAWLHSAWCIDADDRVIDPNLPPIGVAYFGVVFPLSRLPVPAARQTVCWMIGSSSGLCCAVRM